MWCDEQVRQRQAIVAEREQAFDTEGCDGILASQQPRQRQQPGPGGVAAHGSGWIAGSKGEGVSDPGTGIPVQIPLNQIEGHRLRVPTGREREHQHRPLGRMPASPQGKGEWIVPRAERDTILMMRTGPWSGAGAWGAPQNAIAEGATGI